MSKYINNLQLSGIMDDPQIQVLENGRKTAEFLLRMEIGISNEKGDRYTKSLGIKCKAWDQLASIIERFTFQGTEIALEGRLISTIKIHKNAPEEDSYVLVKDLLILSK